MVKVWPLLAKYFEKFGSDARSIERCCQYVRLSPVLSVALQMLEEEHGLRIRPDTVDDLFRLMNRFIQKMLGVFLQSPIYSSLFLCGTEISWDELVEMGEQATEDRLKESILSQAPNYCCMTTFMVIWGAKMFGKNQSFSSSGGAHVSFLPLSQPVGQTLDSFVPLIYVTTVYFVPRELFKWAELIELGNKGSDDRLKECILSQAPNYCCSVTFTTGRTGPPKTVMQSHDNLIWTGKVCGKYQSLASSGGAHVSFLPLSQPSGTLLDIVLPLLYATTVYFAPRKNFKKKVMEVMREVRPTYPVAIPLFYERLVDRMEVELEKSSFKAAVSRMAMNIGRNSYYNAREGKPRPFGWWLANQLVFKKVQRHLGLDRCLEVHSGNSFVLDSTAEFFTGFGILVLNIYGASEMSGPHAFSLPDRHRFGSCGVEMDGCRTRFLYTELRVKGRHVFMGYLNDPEQTENAFDEDGWYRTLDMGYRDESGFLWITGSIVELFETSDDRIVAPIPIEKEVKNRLQRMSHCVAYGHNRPYVIMLTCEHKSPTEHYRVRHVHIFYYLEDDSIAVLAPRVDNSGFTQGESDSEPAAGVECCWMMMVRSVSVDTMADYMRRRLFLCSLDSPRSCVLWHWHFLSWNGCGLPVYRIPFLDFVRRVQRERDSGRRPVIVQCRWTETQQRCQRPPETTLAAAAGATGAGRLLRTPLRRPIAVCGGSKPAGTVEGGGSQRVGTLEGGCLGVGHRAAVFALVWSLLDQTETDSVVNVSAVRYIRCRLSDDVIQNSRQYAFVYQTLSDYLRLRSCHGCCSRRCGQLNSDNEAPVATAGRTTTTMGISWSDVILSRSAVTVHPGDLQLPSVHPSFSPRQRSLVAAPDKVTGSARADHDCLERKNAKQKRGRKRFRNKVTPTVLEGGDFGVDLPGESPVKGTENDLEESEELQCRSLTRLETETESAGFCAGNDVTPDAEGTLPLPVDKTEEDGLCSHLKETRSKESEGSCFGHPGGMSMERGPSLYDVGGRLDSGSAEVRAPYGNRGGSLWIINEVDDDSDAGRSIDDGDDDDGGRRGDQRWICHKDADEETLDGDVGPLQMPCTPICPTTVEEMEFSTDSDDYPEDRCITPPAEAKRKSFKAAGKVESFRGDGNVTPASSASCVRPTQKPKWSCSAQGDRDVGSIAKVADIVDTYGSAGTCLENSRWVYDPIDVSEAGSADNLLPTTSVTCCGGHLRIPPAAAASAPPTLTPAASAPPTVTQAAYAPPTVTPEATAPPTMKRVADEEEEDDVESEGESNPADRVDSLESRVNSTSASVHSKQRTVKRGEAQEEIDILNSPDGVDSVASRVNSSSFHGNQVAVVGEMEDIPNSFHGLDSAGTQISSSSVRGRQRRVKEERALVKKGSPLSPLVGPSPNDVTVPRDVASLEGPNVSSSSRKSFEILSEETLAKVIDRSSVHDVIRGLVGPGDLEREAETAEREKHVSGDLEREAETAEREKRVSVGLEHFNVDSSKGYRSLARLSTESSLKNAAGGLKEEVESTEEELHELIDPTTSETMTNRSLESAAAAVQPNKESSKEMMMGRSGQPRLSRDFSFRGDGSVDSVNTLSGLSLTSPFPPDSNGSSRHSRRLATDGATCISPLPPPLLLPPPPLLLPPPLLAPPLHPPLPPVVDKQEVHLPSSALFPGSQDVVDPHYNNNIVSAVVVGKSLAADDTNDFIGVSSLASAASNRLAETYFSSQIPRSKTAALPALSEDVSRSTAKDEVPGATDKKGSLAMARSGLRVEMTEAQDRKRTRKKIRQKKKQPQNESHWPSQLNHMQAMHFEDCQDSESSLEWIRRLNLKEFQTTEATKKSKKNSSSSRRSSDLNCIYSPFAAHDSRRPFETDGEPVDRAERMAELPVDSSLTRDDLDEAEVMRREHGGNPVRLIGSTDGTASSSSSAWNPPKTHASIDFDDLRGGQSSSWGSIARLDSKDFAASKTSKNSSRASGRYESFTWGATRQRSVSSKIGPTPGDDSVREEGAATASVIPVEVGGRPHRRLTSDEDPVTDVEVSVAEEGFTRHPNIRATSPRTVQPRGRTLDPCVETLEPDEETIDPEQLDDGLSTTAGSDSLATEEHIERKDDEAWKHEVGPEEAAFLHVNTPIDKGHLVPRPDVGPQEELQELSSGESGSGEKAHGPFSLEPDEEALPPDPTDLPTAHPADIEAQLELARKYAPREIRVFCNGALCIGVPRMQVGDIVRCEALGTPSPKISFTIADGRMVDSAYYELVDSDRGSLTITCIAKNLYGSMTSKIVLTVSGDSDLRDEGRGVDTAGDDNCNGNNNKMWDFPPKPLSFCSEAPVPMEVDSTDEPSHLPQPLSKTTYPWHQPNSHVGEDTYSASYIPLLESKRAPSAPSKRSTTSAISKAVTSRKSSQARQPAIAKAESPSGPSENKAATMIPHTKINGISFPTTWKPPYDSYQLVDLKPNSKEYTDITEVLSGVAKRSIGGVKTKFATGQPALKNEVLNIQRVQAPALFEAYSLRRLQMQEKNGGRDPEQWYFHGSTKRACYRIAQHGFNFNKIGKNSARLGNGFYVSSSVLYASNPEYAVPDCDDHQRILLARVLRGKYCEGLEGLEEPPYIETGRMYDSVVNDTKKPTMVCVFDKGQIYSSYVITIKKN